MGQLRTMHAPTGPVLASVHLQATCRVWLLQAAHKLELANLSHYLSKATPASRRAFESILRWMCSLQHNLVWMSFTGIIIRLTYQGHTAAFVRADLLPVGRRAAAQQSTAGVCLGQKTVCKNLAMRGPLAMLWCQWYP